MRGRLHLLALPLCLALISAAPTVPSVDAPAVAGQQEQGQLLISRETGAATFVKAPAGDVLRPVAPGTPPEQAARDWLSQDGQVLGLSAMERAAVTDLGAAADAAGTGSRLERRSVHADQLGMTHVRFSQTYAGLEVVGGDLYVHLDEDGTTGASGTFVPGVDVGATPSVTADEAASTALKSVALSVGSDRGLTVLGSTLKVLRTGLVEGFVGENRLAWAVEVEGTALRDEVFVDAHQGGVLTAYGHVNHAMDRCVYTPIYDPANPQAGLVREEGSSDTFVPPIDNLYNFAGDVHEFFQAAFERDSYDGAGAKMISVYLIDAACPNAFWNGQATNYCPGFDVDDVVAHEWGHAYTEYTHDLIYGWQAGALNESYSDIWGETIDLLNEADGVGGSNNDAPWPDGQRWLLGEDFTEEAQQLLLRDMWDPERLGSPASVDSADYGCSTSDQGGVHTNSGVPNHAYAMLVDGKTFNDITVEGLGLTKAAHIYFRAQEVYQTRATNFPQHSEALAASCADLIGQDLNDLLSGEPSGDVITADDCVQVDNAMLATGMQELPEQCGFATNYPDTAPEPCVGALEIFATDLSTGVEGWSLGNAGTFPNSWPGFDWITADALPDGRSGGIFANDNVAGTCLPGGDYSGSFWADSPAFTIPEGATDAILSFDHFSETELNFDGGNVKVDVNGGGFEVLSADHYLANPPVNSLAAIEDLNTNPMAGELAYNGGQAGNDVTGTWATSAIDLASLAGPGDEVVVRFEFGMDGCNGTTGWYVDNVVVYSCLLADPDADVGGETGTNDPDPAPDPEPEPEPEPSPEPLPATGGGLVVLGVLTASSGWRLRRRR